MPRGVSQNPDDGFVVVINDSPPEGLRSAVENAIEACPASVVSLEDE